MDAWLREAEEASQWVEEMENIMNHNNLNFSVSIVHSSRSKLLELGVKLDRLESLLRNPPPKPILTDEDLDFRWKMFSDIQLRTRTLARSLYALPLPNRPRNASHTAGKEYDVSLGYYDQVEGAKRHLVFLYGFAEKLICCKPRTPRVNQSCLNLFYQNQMMQTELRFNRLVLCQGFPYGRLAQLSYSSWDWLH
ncbi:hypothetical protein VNO77_18482 [Canavalia gladiata]|uniref:Uncharacterized protein n=1 Tax=Canavalia gladiata TaxID=3824 RepID=A0AAN9QJN8_CANGL